MEENRKKWKTRPKVLFPLDAYQDLKPEDLAYASGLIDGEGHIGFHKAGSPGRRRIYPIIVVRMMDRGPVEFLSFLFEGKVGTVRVKSTETVTRSPYIYSWQVVGRRAGAVACAILPLLKSVKKFERAELAMRAGAVVGLYTRQDELRDPSVAALIKSLREEMKGFVRPRT